jgi:hypothetical protein
MEPLEFHKVGVLEGCTSVVTGSVSRLQRYRDSYSDGGCGAMCVPACPMKYMEMILETTLEYDGCKSDWPMISRKGH